jgi:Protein of unknown function (DUF3987)
MTFREEVIGAHKTLLNDSGRLSYFEQRGISKEALRAAWVGYDDARGAFLYPCIAKGGGLLGIHYKSEGRDDKGKRRQEWGGYAHNLPRKGHGKNPNDPAKVIPFGLEILGDLKSGSLVVLCCGEEDALSVQQAGYAAVSQPGAGLLEPAYARALAGLEVVVFYDAGEEQEAREDALKLLTAGAKGARVVEWPKGVPHGLDINGKLVEDPKGFGRWLADMIAAAKPPGYVVAHRVGRDGDPDAYVPIIPETPAWPTLDEEALCGLPGDVVRAIEPHTEADPVAVLASLLAGFGNAIGRGVFFRVGADVHHLKLNAGLVGDTSKGRKGMSWGHVRELMRASDERWTEERVLHGLSSGEGLIYAVRDRVEGENRKGETVIVDEGVEDKRLLVLEAELAGVLKVMSREGNTLSPVIRQAWDDGALQTLTKNSPMKASNAHVSMIGHITKAELLRHLTETEAANGFANRFIWLLVKRSKELPFGGEWYEVDTAPLVRRLCSALEFGSVPVLVTWGDSAREIWREVYGPLSEGKPGLFGAVVGRAEAQVMRLAALYAVMGESHEIEREHLLAALALWDYSEKSARYIFGDATGDPVADQILEALRAAGKDGMTKTEISHLLGRNRSAERIAQALSLLLAGGRVCRKTQKTGGRQAERWFVA